MGKGAFGTVRRAFTEDGKAFALKSVNAQCRYAKAEQETHESLDHKHVLKMVEVIESHAIKYFVLELAHCNLSQLHYDRRELQGPEFKDDEIRTFLCQIVHGLQYLCERGVVHRDMKPENILLDKRCDIKIADFGLAKQLKDDEY